MAVNLPFRRKAVRTLTNQIGCYVLCDLDQVPIYVGQSVDGIRSRVNRHLTSARSDIIANRQVDVWEIAWVWTYPVADKSDIGAIEDALFHEFHAKSALMNGKVPKRPPNRVKVPEPSQRVQVMADAEIEEKKDPALQLCHWRARRCSRGGDRNRRRLGRRRWQCDSKQRGVEQRRDQRQFIRLRSGRLWRRRGPNRRWWRWWDGNRYGIRRFERQRNGHGFGVVERWLWRNWCLWG